MAASLVRVLKRRVEDDHPWTLDPYDPMSRGMFDPIPSEYIGGVDESAMETALEEKRRVMEADDKRRATIAALSRDPAAVAAQSRGPLPKHIPGQTPYGPSAGGGSWNMDDVEYAMLSQVHPGFSKSSDAFDFAWNILKAAPYESEEGAGMPDVNWYNRIATCPYCQQQVPQRDMHEHMVANHPEWMDWRHLGFEEPFGPPNLTEYNPLPPDSKTNPGYQ